MMARKQWWCDDKKSATKEKTKKLWQVWFRWKYSMVMPINNWWQIVNEPIGNEDFKINHESTQKIIKEYSEAVLDTCSVKSWKWKIQLWINTTEF